MLNNQAMKLYEFTYHDNQNLSEPEVLGRLKDLLETEAEMQGWASGYNLRQCKEVEQKASGERVFTFEVLGDYLDSDFIDFAEEVQLPAVFDNTKVAKDAEL